jgi:hypothetical protein
MMPNLKTCFFIHRGLHKNSKLFTSNFKLFTLNSKLFIPFILKNRLI